MWVLSTVGSVLVEEGTVANAAVHELNIFKSVFLNIAKSGYLLMITFI